jgi:hypothetical protein
MNMTAAAQDAGMSRTERKELFDGTLFDSADSGLLLMLRNSLRETKKRKRALDMLELRNERPVSHTQIIKLLDRFYDIKEQAKAEITEHDRRFLNFAIHYLERWFYEGSWAKPHERYKDEERPYLQYSVPAALTNMLTKFKQDTDIGTTLTAFEPARLRKLFDATSAHLPATLSADVLKRIHEAETAIRYPFAHTRNQAADLYLMKTCLIAGEILRRTDGDLEKAVRLVPRSTDPSEYLRFDFSSGKDPVYQSMHYPPARLPFCIAVVAHLQHSHK